MNFELTSAYKPTGDQPEAIAQLTEGVLEGVPAQTLLGVTGSGKTFTIANVIANINKPTLILSHNKTLAAQLYSEFKGFFPNNAVEYYVSYYDYYQPEAYLPSSDTYIEKVNGRFDTTGLKKRTYIYIPVTCLRGITWCAMAWVQYQQPDKEIFTQNRGCSGRRERKSPEKRAERRRCSYGNTVQKG